MESLLLDKIDQPSDLKKLNAQQVEKLCAEIRHFMLENISKTGGHLASNLGTVELTVALHRVLETPKDKIVFDVGHQCYTHKILTGRREQFSSLRQYGGLSGFPKPRESGHDAFIAGHASNSVSVARSGDSIEVRRSKFDTKLVRLSKRSFCEILQKKMLMGGTSNEE